MMGTKPASQVSNAMAIPQSKSVFAAQMNKMGLIGYAGTSGKVAITSAIPISDSLSSVFVVPYSYWHDLQGLESAKATQKVRNEKPDGALWVGFGSSGARQISNITISYLKLNIYFHLPAKL